MAVISQWNFLIVIAMRVCQKSKFASFAIEKCVYFEIHIFDKRSKSQFWVRFWVWFLIHVYSRIHTHSEKSPKKYTLQLVLLNGWKCVFLVHWESGNLEVKHIYDLCWQILLSLFRLDEFACSLSSIYIYLLSFIWLQKEAQQSCLYEWILQSDCWLMNVGTVCGISTIYSWPSMQ